MTQSKVIHIPVSGGIRLDVSENNAPPGTLIDARNVRLSTPGEAESRPGAAALDVSTDADVSWSDVLDGSLGMLARVPGGFVMGCQGFGYRFDIEQLRLHASGSYSNAEPLGVFDVIAREEADSTTGYPFPLSQAATNGYVCTVHSCGNGQASIGPGDNRVLVHVFTEDGTLVASAHYTNVSAAWVVADGGDSTQMVLFLQGTTTAIDVRVITTSQAGATIGSSSNYETLNSAASYWAACTLPGIGWALVAQTGAATATIRTVASGVTVDTVTFAVTGTVPLSLYADASNVYVGWAEGNDSDARVYDTTLTLTSSGTTVIVSPGNQGPPVFGPSRDADSAMFVITVSPSAAIDDTSSIYYGRLTSAGVAAPNHRAYQCTALSAPFGDGYVWVRAAGYDNVPASGPVRPLLLDFMDERVSGASLASNAGAWDSVVALSCQLMLKVSASQSGWYKMHLSAPAELSDGTLVMGIPRIVRTGAASFAYPICEWLRFRLGGRRQVAPFQDAAIVAGFPTLTKATLGTRNYDGSLTLAPQNAGIDLGFPMPPAGNVTVSNGAGSLTPGATYQWRIVIERIDSDGTRHRSAPSAITSRTLGASDDTGTVTGRMNMNWLRANAGLWHSSRFVMHVYRTEANGSTFYRSTPDIDAPVASTAGVFSFTDTLADSLLRVGEILYTDGGVLPNDCPPSCRFVAATEDRVWLAGLWETEQLQSSKILVPGEPPQFSDLSSFRVVLPEPCTGVAVQDGVVVAFTESGIYAIQGSGPNDQGQGAWESPRLITRSTGCNNADSILVTNIGIFFQSAQGIELLPRGLGEPQFVGMPVQSLMYSTTLGRQSLVTAAAVITTAQGRTARFVVDDGEDTNFVLVFDLDTQAWSRDTYASAYLTGITDSDGGAILPLDAVSSQFGALREVATRDTDALSVDPEIPCELEWAPLRPFGIAGQGRFSGAIGLFARKPTPSSGYRAGNATIALSVDGATAPGKTFSMSAALGSNDYMKCVPLRQSGTSGRLTFTTAVAGWRFMGWTVELEDQGGGRRMGETEQG